MKKIILSKVVALNISMALLFAGYGTIYASTSASTKSSVQISKSDYSKFVVQITDALNIAKFQDSLNTCNNLLSKYPKNGDLYYWKSISLFNLDKYEDGEKAADSAIALDSNNSKYYEAKAKNNYFGKNYKSSITLKAAEKAISLNSNSYIGYLYKARAMEDSKTKGYTKAYDASINICNNLINTSKSIYDTVDILKTKASCFYDFGLYSEYINVYLQCININPKLYVLYKQIGFTYNEKEDYSKSIQYFNKALSLNSSDGDIYEGLGDAYYDLKDFDKAIYYYKKLVALEPDYATGYNDLGDCYDEKDLEDIANDWYTKGKALEAKNKKSTGSKL